MIRDSGRQGVILGAAVFAGIVSCVIATPLAGGDPLLGLELLSGSIAALWGSVVIVNLLRAGSLRRGLERVSEERSIDGIRVRVVAGGGRMAMAVTASYATPIAMH